ETDEQRLQQVLKNLLSNAVKFTEQGQVVLRIGIAPDDYHYASSTLESAEQVLAFSVADTGIGVPDDKLRLIFEAFQQADGTTARKYGGTGLGLSIIREIARLLGGEIQVESAPGTGCTFTLYLPTTYHPELARPAVYHTNAASGAETASGETLAPEAGRRRDLLNELGDDRSSVQPDDRVLLVVETDAEVARTALAAGRNRGFKVVVANGWEAAQ